MDEPEIRKAAIDYETGERFVSLRDALGVTSFGINQLTLEPRQRNRIHRHALQDEVYLVLRGRLTVAIEGAERELGEGELIHVPASVRRQLLNRSAERCTLLALGAAGEHVSRDAEAYGAWSDEEGRPPRDVPLPPDLA
jgi:quercetin dioxygenase-like cupin family protein